VQKKVGEDEEVKGGLIWVPFNMEKKLVKVGVLILDRCEII
jgi:hypothetical protein